jgi:CRP-like cAMP-binding protein
MTNTQPSLAKISLFEDLSPEELSVVSELTTEIQWKAGEEVYALGEQGGFLFVVLEGAVELFGLVSGVEKLFMTVREGGVFGLLSMLDQGDRPGNARALEDTRGLTLGREELDRLLNDKPGVGIKVLQGVGRILGQRVRTLNEQYDATLAWNLDVTGLASLNLERVMTDRIEVTVQTVSGEPIRGTLLRFEQSTAGHELYLKGSDSQIHLIPYHAVVRISLAADQVEHRDDAPTF